MLGLQTTYDMNTTMRLCAAANSNSNLSSSSGRSGSIGGSDAKNSRSWKFSNHLYKAGFDNVVGQSSSLEKHTKVQKGMSPAEKERKRRTNVVTKLAHEQFVDMQDQHALEDAERLKEVQNKLEDLQRRKGARIRRDRSRRQRKVQYMAARKIQYFFKFVMLDAKERAAKILRNFVRKVVNRNALSVASWASGVIARFAKYATRRWKTLKILRGLSSGMAHGMWDDLGGRAVAEIAGRKMVAKFVTFQSLRQGLTLVARKKIAHMREMSRQKKKEKRWGKARGVKKVAGMMSSPKKSPTSTSSKSPSPKGDRKGDTSFTHSEDSDSSRSQMSPPQTKDTVEGLVQESKKNFVDPSHIPSANPAPDVNASQTDLSSMGMSMMDMNFDLAADLSDEEYDEDEELEREHREQMRQAHMAKQAAQERERQARLRAIEKAKVEREEEDRERELLERMRLEAAEQARQDWLDTQDAIRERRSKKMTRTRKFRAKEDKREAKEQVLMTAEDTMVPKAKQNAWVPGTIPKQKKKKEREQTEFELEMAMEREEEEAREKEEAAQKLYELNKENTETRLRKKKEQREKQAVEKEKEEISRKEKMERLKESTEAARVRAVEAKKIADMHAKQRQKELDAVDASDKVPRGRSHNASGKPVLKGFVRPEDRDKENSKGKRSKKGIDISSKVAVRDPTVRQWNYEVDPAVGGHRTAEEPIEGLKEYNEFLSAAEEHTLDEVDVITGDDYWPFGEESNDEHGDIEESLSSDLDWGRSREEGEEGDEVQLGEVVQKKPSSAELQPGGARKKKSKKKEGPPTKATVAEIAGVSHKKKVVIPPKLKDSAYFKSYKTVKKAEMAAEASADAVDNDRQRTEAVTEGANAGRAGEVVSSKRKPRKKVRRGKVATMLEMINKARKKLDPQQGKSTATLPVPTSQKAADASPTSELLASKSNPALHASPDSFAGNFASQTAPIPHFPSPPKIGDFGVEVATGLEDQGYADNAALPPEMIHEELGDEVRNGEPMSGSLEQYYFASKEASIEGKKGFSSADFPPSRNQAVHSPIEVNPPAQPQEVRAAPVMMEEETEEAREERRQEEALNAECDNLLMRLEKRLGVNSGQESSRPVANAGDANEENKNLVQKAKKVPFPTGIPVAEKSLAPKAPPGMSKKFPKAPAVDSYMGDYSIGVDLPSFNLPADSDAKVPKKKSPSNLLDQWKND